MNLYLININIKINRMTMNLSLFEGRKIILSILFNCVFLLGTYPLFNQTYIH